MADTQREIESKFDVAPDFVVGDLSDLIRQGDSLDVDTIELISIYYDTPELDLLRSRLTLRRRTGDADTGWHLKVPGDGFRTELRWPLDEGAPSEDASADDASAMPEELRALVTVFTHGAEVEPIMQLKVQRSRHRVSNATGELRFELADDQVRATGLASQLAARRWREVEVELGPAGTQSDLIVASALLIDRGAFASKAPSKLVRAIYGHAGPVATEGSVGAELMKYVQVQCDAITAGHFAVSLMPFDPEATSEPHEAVHQTRVATRRLRAALRTFAPVFDPVRASRLEAELKWYAAELGAVRDREVLRIRLARALEELPAFLVVGPVAEQIDAVLLGELHAHAEALLQIMRSARYHDLIDELGQWRTEPPLTPAADQPASEMAQYVAAAEKTLHRRLKRARARHASDEQLHAARKAGKRARYAAEASTPALGKHASTLARAAADLQTLLGEHQDAVVATELLRRIADLAAEQGQNTFTYGILVADQRRAAADSAEAARTTARS
ncbi:CYTH and CHAD domain-containing protein [soil metagenome]